MSEEHSGNGDSPAVLNGGDPEHLAGEAGPARSRGARGTAGPALHRRTGQALDDWRLQSLRTGDVPVVAPRSDHRHRHQRPLLATAAIFVAVAALAVVLLQAFVVRSYTVHGDAMTPNLATGDRILVVKPDLLRGPIRSGDVVVVHPPKSLPCSVVGGVSGDLVLRVAAVPGSVISTVGDTIHVDGRPLRGRRWYDPRFGEIGSLPIRRTTLTAGRYFVLADNRSNACDSRTFGPILESSIVGEGVAVVGRAGHVSFGTL